MPVIKTCSKCKQIKPLHDFYKSSKKPDGHQSYCKKCVVEYNLERANNLADNRFKRLISKVNPQIEYKKCGRCQIVKPVADFYNNVHQTDGYYTYCKPCTKEYKKERKNKNND